jgi:hypothetical protein
MGQGKKTRNKVTGTNQEAGHADAWEKEKLAGDCKREATVSFSSVYSLQFTVHNSSRKKFTTRSSEESKSPRQDSGLCVVKL